MRKMKILLGLGIWVALLPYLGFPSSWKTVLFTLSGLAAAVIAYLAYRELSGKEENIFDNFKENNFEGDPEEKIVVEEFEEIIKPGEGDL